LAQNQANTGGSGIDYPVHTLRTAMKTFRCATAHLSLIICVAIQTGVDYVGNLLD
jgi:hypothetical protein